MAVTYVIEFFVRPEGRLRFEELLTGVLEAMRQEEMFVSAALSVDDQDPNHLLLHETWLDHQNVLDVQLSRPYRAQYHAELPGLLQRERVISMWRPLRQDVARGLS